MNNKPEDRFEDAESLEELFSIFAERNEIYTDFTEMILEALEPTVVAALLELFNCLQEQILWNAVEIDDTLLFIECVVQYDDPRLIPSIINQVATINTEGGDDTMQRIVRLGIPLNMLFQPKEEIQKHLLDSVNSQPATDSIDAPHSENTVATLDRFDYSGLSKEQVMQMLIFQHQSKGVKH